MIARRIQNRRPRNGAMCRIYNLEKASHRKETNYPNDDDACKLSTLTSVQSSASSGYAGDPKTGAWATQANGSKLGRGPRLTKSFRVATAVRNSAVVSTLRRRLRALFEEPSVALGLAALLRRRLSFTRHLVLLVWPVT